MSSENEMIYTGFNIGDGLGLVSDSTFALLETTNGALAERLWELIEGGAGVDELLEELSTRGLRSLGSFALAQVEGDGLRVVVRGAAIALVDTGATVERFEPTGVKTWLEHVVDHCVRFSLTLDQDVSTASPYRVARALLPAVSLHWPVTAEIPDLTALDLAELARFVPPLDESGVIISPVSDLQLSDVQAPAEPTAAVNVVEPASPDSIAPAGAPDEVAELLPLEAEPPGEPPAAEPPMALEHTLIDTGEVVVTSGDTIHISNYADDDADAGYDALYGHTVHRSVQMAAVVSEAGDEIPAGTPDDHLPQPLPRPDPAPPDPAPSAPVSGGLISGVPTAGGGPVVAPVASAEGDHDGMTISVAQLRAMRAESGTSDPAPPSMGGPTVQALICPSGHPNPPQAGTCRVCSAPLAATQTTIARPSMGRITMSTGTVIELTRPAIVGRNPKVEGRLPSEVPQTIRIDVGQALSRSHMMVRLEGWQVLVEDLGSANGTTVTLPGRPPRRLHSGEPILLEHGAQIDLGGEVIGTYELTG